MPATFTAEHMPACTAATGTPAAALCTVCGAPFSAPYLAIRLDGRAACHPCVRKHDVPCIDLLEAAATRDPVLRGGWHKAIVRVALHPHRTFAAIYNGPLGETLLFGLVATALGYAATTGWNLTLHNAAFIEYYRDVALQRDLTFESDASLKQMLWLVTPALAAARFIIGALLLHIGMRIIAGSQRASLHSEARVFALASSTLVLCVIPVIGPFVALVSWIGACMAYAQVVHGLSTGRALMAVFPSFLVITALGPSSFVPG